MNSVTKRTGSVLALGLAMFLTGGSATAEVTTNKEAKPDDWNKKLILQPLNANAKQAGNSTAYSKTQQLRCWQHGDLIVLENNFRPVDGGKGKLMTKGSENLYAYDYGETFCVYLGG